MTLIFISLLVTLFSYWNIFNSFFQQDEWLSFAFNHLLSGSIFSVVLQIFAPTVGHFQPFNTLLLYLATNLFGINYLPYAVMSIVLHLCNVYLVFYLTKFVFRNEKLAFISSLLFGTNPTIHQATTWIMADTGIHLSVFFALLSTIQFLKFLETERVKSFVISLVFLLISLFFKETAIAFFVFLPLVYYVLSNKKQRKEHKFPLIIFFTGIFYILIRALMIFMPSAYSNSNTLVTSSQSYFHLIYNFFTIPAKAFVQSIFPNQFLLGLSKNISVWFPENIRGSIGTTIYDTFVLKRVYEGLTLFIFVIIIILLTVLFFKYKELKNKKHLLLFTIFVLINSFIYAFSPEQTGIISEVASRNLYFVSIGTTLLIVLIFKKVYLLLIPIVIINITILNNQLNYLVENSNGRKEILNQIEKDNLVLKDKQIFYFESDTSYYGLPDDVRILPFQSGFGQTLIVWYSKDSDLPDDFYKEQFLWNLKSQGYKEIDGRGFGYFRDFDLLKSTLKEYNLPEDIVVAYSWNGKENKLTNISEIVRSKLKNEKVIRK